jgi:ferredoxin-nitrite reductase
VIGSHDLYEHPHINDLAFMPAEKDGVFGFNVEVGGFFSAVRVDGAIPLGAFVPPEQMIPITHAILTTFRDYGARQNRQKTRLMYLIEEMGMDKFRAEIEKRMIGGSGIKSLAEEGKSLVNPKWERRTYFGAHKQTDGNNFVGMNVPVGRIFADDMLTLAHLAETYGKSPSEPPVDPLWTYGFIPPIRVCENMRG